MELAKEFAAHTDKDFSEVLERWKGSPDVIMEDLFRVRDPDTREVSDLKLFPYQRKCTYAYFYGDSSTIVCYKGRRVGLTFIYELCMALDSLRNPNTVYPIVCQSGEDSKKRIDDLVDIFEMCRLPINPSDDGWKSIATKLILPNGSRFESFTAGSDAGRGDDPARAVLMDEMAFFPDQDDTVAAFGASTALGGESTEIRVSTPKVEGDTFMKSFDSGSPTGFVDEAENPVKSDHPEATPVPISIKQPSLKNAEEIDIEKSLHKQDVTPVRADLDIQTLEERRLTDPKKFAQEFLCRPISDEYRFFSSEAVKEAMERSQKPAYSTGIGVKSEDMMVMGVDLAFGGADDSVMSVFEHKPGKQRNMRYFEVIDREALELAGIAEPDVGNADHVARRCVQVARSMGVDHIIFDATGGNDFENDLRRYTGRGLHPFNFSDQETFREMAHGLNYGLRNGDTILLQSKLLREQLLAIVKKQREDFQNPKFSGKEYSPSGKDDAAVATIMAAYPPFLSDGGKKLYQVEDDNPVSQAEQYRQDKIEQIKTTGSGRKPREGFKWGSFNMKRGNRYSKRHNNY